MAKLSSPRLWNMLEDGPRSDARNDMPVGQLVRTWVLDRQQQQAASNFHPFFASLFPRPAPHSSGPRRNGRHVFSQTPRSSPGGASGSGQLLFTTDKAVRLPRHPISSSPRPDEIDRDASKWRQQQQRFRARQAGGVRRAACGARRVRCHRHTVWDRRQEATLPLTAVDVELPEGILEGEKGRD